MPNTIDEIFAALISGGDESTKTAGDDDDNGAESASTDQNQTAADATAKAEGAEEEKKEAAAALAKFLPAEQIESLRVFVKTADEAEKNAELQKQADEAIATGRFMARGFLAELDKVSQENNGEADFSDKAVTMGVANVPTPANSQLVNDGSGVINTANKEDAQKSPASPTASQDVVKAVKAVINAADSASKGQDPQEVPNNLGIKDTATNGNASAQPNNKG